MPSYATTPKYLLRKLLGSDLVADIDAGFDALATDVEANFTGYKSGTGAARGSQTAFDGLLWRDTDIGGIWLGNGSTFLPFTHLAYRLANTSLTANAGDLIVAASGTTITLPTPSVNALVAVVAGSPITTSVTVSGANIYGVGLNSASSLKLGVTGASVLLQSDGTNWLIIAGQQDGGWITGFASGVSINPGTGAATPAGRLIGDRVYLKGALTTTGTISASQTILGPLSGLPAPATARKPILGTNSTPAQCSLGSSLSNGAASIASGVTIDLDCSYSVS